MYVSGGKGKEFLEWYNGNFKEHEGRRGERIRLLGLAGG